MKTPAAVMPILARKILSIGLFFTVIACSNTPQLDKTTISATQPLTPKIAYVQPVEIAFASYCYWLKEQKRDHSTADLEALQERYSQRLTQALIETLSEQGWQVSTSRSASSIDKTSVIAKVENMRITAPDFEGSWIDLYSNDEHGSADFAIVFEKNSEIQAQFEDQRRVHAGAGGSQLTRTSRVINEQAFVREFKRFLDDSFELASQNAVSSH